MKPSMTEPGYYWHQWPTGPDPVRERDEARPEPPLQAGAISMTDPRYYECREIDWREVGLGFRRLLRCLFLQN